jgi:tetratricopeptide (TPR) repeat protein
MPKINKQHVTNFVKSNNISLVVLKVLFYIILNLLLLYTSLKIYASFCSELVNKTEDVFDIKNFLIVILSISTIFIIVTTKIKIIKHFGIGIMSLLVVCSLFIIFTVNKKFGSIGKYYDYKIIEAASSNKKNYLDIRYHDNRISIEVDLEDCLKVDFVKIRIDNGLLGMPFITCNYKLEENNNCKQFEIKDSATFLNNHAKYHIEIGHYYARIRCFTSAIEHYSYSIIQDSLNENRYYNRGLMYTVKHDYKKALKDFYSAAIIANCKIDTNLLSKSKGLKIDDVLNNLMENSEKNETQDLEAIIYKMELFSNFDDYKSYIEYCIEKTKTK